MLRFFWNGIKVDGGKLQKATIHINDRGEITIYGKHYIDFSREIAEALTVVNHTDSQSDYFCNDRITVSPGHPLYEEVKVAALKAEARWQTRLAAHEQKLRGPSKPKPPPTSGFCELCQQVRQVKQIDGVKVCVLHVTEAEWDAAPDAEFEAMLDGLAGAITADRNLIDMPLHTAVLQ